MQLGFVTAVLPELPLAEVLKFAAAERFDCIEVMCWPVGKAERKFAGVTHIDVTEFTRAAGPTMSARWPRSTTSRSRDWATTRTSSRTTRRKRASQTAHLKKVIQGARLLGLNNVNTFIGADHRPQRRRKLRSLSRSLARPDPVCRRSRHPRRHRELPDALYLGRMAGGQEYGVFAGRVAADVRGDPPRATLD